jgi:hypothetical protein
MGFYSFFGNLKINGAITIDKSLCLKLYDV